MSWSGCLAPSQSGSLETEVGTGVLKSLQGRVPKDLMTSHWLPLPQSSIRPPNSTPWAEPLPCRHPNTAAQGTAAGLRVPRLFPFCPPYIIASMG